MLGAVQRRIEGEIPTPDLIVEDRPYLSRPCVGRETITLLQFDHGCFRRNRLGSIDLDLVVVLNEGTACPKCRDA